jgi:NAD(P)-dependent dehydrogenase (short-subunit alcohol dehydrogenase family)
MLENSQDTHNAGHVAIVIGTSSKIAISLIERLVNDASFTKIIAISRQVSEEAETRLSHKLSRFQSDYSEQSISEICEQLRPYKGKISRVFICNGILHDSHLQPEKRLDDLNPENLHKVYEVNAIIPMLWIKYLKNVLSKEQGCVVTVFSARIGSIEDNRSGGWYSYRASKAALNMLLKTAAIEYERVLKGTRFLVFHPGTTDTPLSRPFQKYVSPNKLFKPEFVADQLLALIERDSLVDDNIQFLGWDGNKIPW